MRFLLFSVLCIFSSSSHLSHCEKKTATGGRGKYRPSKLRGGNGHILIFGGGVDSGSASIVENFLQALCRDEDTPDIVLLGQNPATAEVRSVIKKLNNKLFYVKFFQGTPMSVDDLERVRVDLCSFAFVLCDFNSINPLIEDESNILRTAALARFEWPMTMNSLLSSCCSIVLCLIAMVSRQVSR